MVLSIKDPQADQLARELARRTGQSLTEAVIDALTARLAEEMRKDRGQVVRDAMEIARHCAALPDLSQASDDEILGYDADGIPR